MLSILSSTRLAFFFVLLCLRFRVRHHDLDFWRKGASDNVDTNTAEILDPENIDADDVAFPRRCLRKKSVCRPSITKLISLADPPLSAIIQNDDERPRRK